MQLKENQSRARTAKIWIQLSIALYILAIPYSFYLLYIQSKIDAFDFYPEDLQVFVIITGLIAVLGLTAFIGSAITFIQWFRRAYWNAHQLFSGLRYSEGWAAGAWFVPVFWWFGPYQIAADFYKKTEARLRQEGLVSGSSKFHLVGWWWGLWIASSIIDNVDVRFGISENTEIYIGIVSNLLGIGAGFFALKFIDNYNDLERKLSQIDEPGIAISDDADLLD